MSIGFVRWTLRTRDVAAARAFYGALLEEGAPEATELPAVLRERGVPPHWLGHLAVADVEATMAAFVARGALRLGPGPLLRDAGGAVLGLTTPEAPTRRDVGLQQLLTADPAQARRDYGDLAGMKVGPRVEVPPHGAFESFSWGAGAPCGSIGGIAGRPGVHAQWLFHFRVAALEGAMAQVRAAGGTVLGPTALPDGRAVAVCEDPQGAQFGLVA